MNAFVSGEGDGRRLEAPGMQIHVRVGSEQTGGQFSIVELRAAGGFVAPPVLHVHPAVDWSARVLAGTMAVRAGGAELVVPAGSILVIPRGTPFRWWNASQDEPVQFQATYTPGGFERFFLDMHRNLSSLGRPPSPEEIARCAQQLWKEHGVEVHPG